MANARCYKCQQKFAPERAAPRVCRSCRGTVKPPPGVPFWYILRGNKEHGPFLWRQLVAMATQGGFADDDMVRQEGVAHWIRATAMRALVSENAAEQEPDHGGTDIPVDAIKEAQTVMSVPQSEVLASPVAHPPQPATELAAVAPGWGIDRAVLRVAVGALVAGCFFGISSNYLQLRPDRGRPSVSDKTGEEQQEFVGRVAPKKSDVLIPRDIARPDDFVATKQTVKPKSAEPKPEPGTVSEWTERFLTQLNKDRMDAGLGPVVLSATLSPACTAHAQYLVRNVEPQQATGNNVYQENPSKPAYTRAGQEAGRVALVLYGRPSRSLDVWMSRLFSRLQLLNPELQTIGIGFAPTTQGDVVCVVDATNGRTDALVVYPVAGEADRYLVARSTLDALKQRRTEPRAAVYPYPGQDNVPCVDPDAKGFPISVSFPKDKTLRNVRVSLTDDQGQGVKVLVSSPPHSIGVHPAEALQPGRTYRMAVGVTVNDADWSRQWEFITRR